MKNLLPLYFSQRFYVFEALTRTCKFCLLTVPFAIEHWRFWTPLPKAFLGHFGGRFWWFWSKIRKILVSTSTSTVSTSTHSKLKIRMKHQNWSIFRMSHHIGASKNPHIGYFSPNKGSPRSDILKNTLYYWSF